MVRISHLNSVMLHLNFNGKTNYSGVPKREKGDSDIHFLKYDSRDLSKKVRKNFKKGASPHLQELEGRGPKSIWGYAP